MALDRIVDRPLFSLTRRKPDLIALADRARDAGQWEAAAQFYRKVLDRYPRNSGTWVQYGHALKESGELRDPDKLAQAEKAYRTALSLDPGAADTYVQLGHVLKLQGETEEARGAYLRAFALDPSMPYALQELSGLGWSEAEMAGLRGLVGSNLPPASSSALEAVPRNDARRGLKESRLGLMRRKSSVIDLADRARDARQWERAAQLYRKALDRNRRNPPIWVQYGHALKESGELRDPGKLAQAELAYRTALSLDPGVADTHLQVGHVLKLQGKTSEAEAAYLRAFVLDPSMPYPQEELTGLGWSEVNLAELRGMLQWEIKKKTFDGSSSSGRSPLTEGDSSADIAVSLIPPAAEGCVSDDPQTLKLYIDKPEIADGSAERTIRSDLLIEGWALARSGVASIDVAVDGHYLTSAHYGMPRSDVAEAHPGWANSERAGFMLSIPGRLLPSGRRAVRVTLRDNSGNTREVAFWIDVAENSGEDGLRRKISQAEIDLQGRLLSSLDWHPNFCLLMSVGYGQDEIARAQTTLVSLREQAYADWHVFITLGDHGGKPDALSNTLVDTLHSFLQDGSNSLESWRDSVLDDFDDVSDRVEILERREEQSLAALIGRFGDPLLFGVLAAGDELSRDALLEFAVISGMHRDADFLYSDELRISPVSKALEPFLKPQ